MDWIPGGYTLDESKEFVIDLVSISNVDINKITFRGEKMSIKDKFIYSIKNNQVRMFLRGENQYNIRSNEGLSHNYLVALVEGVYEAYKEDKNIKNIYENELMEMINSNDLKDLLYSYDYLRLQIRNESKKLSPFELDKTLYLKLRDELIKNKDLLSNFRDIPEYGSKLPNAAYQFIENMDNLMEENYGHKIL